MAAEAAVRVGYYFPSGAPRIGYRTTENESACVIYVIFRVFVKVFFTDRFDDMLLYVVPQFLQRNIGVVLRSHNNGVHPFRLVVFILDSDLRFAVRPQIFQNIFLSNLRQPSRKPVRKQNGQGHQLRSFIRSVTDHHSLVSCSDIFFRRLVHTPSYVRALFVYRCQNTDRLVIEAVFGLRIADILQNVPCNFLHVDIRFCGYLSGNEYEAHAGHGFARDPRRRIALKNLVQNRIGNLI